MLVLSVSPTKTPPERLAGIPDNLAVTHVEVGQLSFEVPSLLVDCFSYIAKDGLVEGIFRVNGSVRRIREVSSDFNGYKPWLDNKEKKPLPHDVCGVIKLFLRDYTTSMNGLFGPSFLQAIRKIYLSQIRHNSAVSSSSGFSGNSSVSVLSSSSALPCIDEAGDAKRIKELNVHPFAESVAHLLLTKNSSRRNNLFFYLIHTLRKILDHQEITKMTPENLSIIFQPYIFTSTNLSVLLTLQEILALLIINEKRLIEEYQKNYNVLGECVDEADTDVISVTSLYSPSKTTSTDYSSVQASPSNNPSNGMPDAGGRFSISQKFSSFWDGYTLPFSKSRRFSFMSRESDKSSDDLGCPGSSVCPHENNKSMESIENIFVSSNAYRKPIELLLATEERGASLERNASADRSRRNSCKPKRRLSIFGAHRSPSSDNTKIERARTISISKSTKSITGEPVNKSVDDLLLSTHKPELAPGTKNLMSRRLSLWIKKT